MVSGMDGPVEFERRWLATTILGSEEGSFSEGMSTQWRRPQEADEPLQRQSDSSSSLRDWVWMLPS